MKHLDCAPFAYNKIVSNSYFEVVNSDKPILIHCFEGLEPVDSANIVHDS